MKWNTLESTPPDELVEVQDVNGNTACAYPTYYPFILEGKGKDVKITQCDNHWDGGWMISCEGLNSPINSEIVKWRLIEAINH